MRSALLAAAVAALALSGTAFTAGGAVPATKLGASARTTGANDVKPAQCASLALTVVVGAAVSYTAPNGVNGLLLGSSLPDSITGRSGNECIVGGGGNDVLNGGGGVDVCIGGPGVDTFANCETVIQ
jgi:Ca2+-binding RTX toxin-like protein